MAVDKMMLQEHGLKLGVCLLTAALIPQATLISAGFFDAGSLAPTVGTNDLAQLTFAVGGPPGLNYYVNNSAPPGQIFTTGNWPLFSGGYPLTSLYVKEQSGTAGGGMPQSSAYTLRIYQVAGTNATLLTTYVSTNSMIFAEGDWMVWGGLTNVLQTNAAYAFSLQANAAGWWRLDNNSGNPYAPGQAVLIPTSGGGITFSSSTAYDAAFVAKFDNSSIFILTQPVGQNVNSGNPFSLSVTASGQPELTYQWLHNGTPVASATNSLYSVASAQVSDAGNYDVVVSNNLNTVISMPAAVTVLNLSDATNESGMFCELLEHPEQTVISAITPSFGWVYGPSFRNDFQTGYRIIVASSQALVGAGMGDMWDSGVVSNSTSINIPYAGASLQPGSNYFWRVQTMNSLGQLGALSGFQELDMAGQLSNPLTNPGVIYQTPANHSTNCYPLRYVPAAPVLVTNTAPGDWFIDFGQDAFGYATVHANGGFGGTTVQARFGEMASGNAVNTAPPGTVRYGVSNFALQNGSAVYSVYPPSFNGSPDAQIISPPSTYGVVLPFRYFELTNFPGILNVTDVVQERLESQFDTNAAAFNSSSANLNQVWNLCRNSMQWLAFDGIYVDGDRERTPYEADTFIHQLSSYAVNNDFTITRCTFEYLTTHPTWPTEWKFHMILTAWADYLQTGNTNLLSKYYSVLQKDSFTWAATGSGLMKGFPNFPQTTNSDIVDWPANDRDGFVITSGSYLNWTNSVVNAFYYRCLQTMANIAMVIGHASDAATYTAGAAQFYSAYNSTFWNSSSQCYMDGVGTTHSSAHANFFPLAFGLVPASNQVAVVNFIHSRISANNGMPSSVYAAQYLLEALFQAGDADTALGLMTTNGSRSWMNMVNIGSTLTDEAWSLADKSNEDWNHAWGAAAGNLIARYVLGLQPLTAGYGQLLIRPQLGQTLSFVQGTIPTIRGPVSIQVTNNAGAWQLLLNVPGNVTATVILPATNTAAILDGSVVSGTLSNNWLAVTNIGSGQHALWASATSQPSLATLYNNWASSWFGTNAGNPAIAGEQADPDGDGMSNYAEFVAGTDPTNPNSKFTVSASASTNSAGPVLVTLPGIGGRTYTLQRSLSLAAFGWSNILSNAVGSNQTLYLADPSPPQAAAFYRVMVALP